MTWDILLLLFGVGVLGGVINAVAGGATLVTFPAMMAAGPLAKRPPHMLFEAFDPLDLVIIFPSFHASRTP